MANEIAIYGGDAAGARSVENGADPGGPDSRLVAIRDAATAGLEPVKAGDMKRAAAKLLYAYPTPSGQDAELQAQAWLEAVVEDLAEYPADVVAEAIRSVRRSLTFRPSSAELRAEAERMVRPRRVVAVRAAQMLAAREAERAEADRIEAIRRSWAEIPDEHRAIIEAHRARMADAVRKMEGDDA